MGTATESNRSRDEEVEEEIIPWKNVPQTVRLSLIKKLNPCLAISGNDWRMLAHELGFGDMISYIESEKENNTKVLFNMYDEKPGASLNDVYRSLSKMKRHDCLTILNDALQDIREAYIQASDSHNFHTAESSDIPAFTGHFHWNHSPCVCPYTSHPVSACGSYLQCSQGFSDCGCSSHHLGHTPYIGHPFLAPPSHPGPCQVFSQSETSPKNFTPSVSSPRHMSPSHGHDRIPHMSPTYTGHDMKSSDRVNVPVTQTIDQRTHSGQIAGQVTYQESRIHGYSESANNNISITGSGSSGTDNFNGKHKLTRPHPDNCNVTPDPVRDKRIRYDSYRGAGMSQESGVFQGTIFPDASMTGQPGNSHSPQFGLHSGASEFMVQGGGYVVEGETQCVQEYVVKVENDQWKNFTDAPSNYAGSSWNRSHPSSTFPMRVKPKQDRTLKEELKELTISQKSTSMPQNMKLGEFRRVFRDIKVFVTYSYDSENHAKQVLSLCRFLQTNGFACCVDVSGRRNQIKTDASKSLEWCRDKVAEADFILACISDKYIQDISSNSQHSSTTEHRLHTREIYKLMHSKHSNDRSSSADNSGSNSSPCFVLLLFPDSKLPGVPEWMIQGPTYNWPAQYKDLAWMLTKPQQRIKTNKDLQTDREL